MSSEDYFYDNVSILSQTETPWMNKFSSKTFTFPRHFKNQKQKKNVKFNLFVSCFETQSNLSLKSHSKHGCLLHTQRCQPLDPKSGDSLLQSPPSNMNLSPLKHEPSPSNMSLSSNINHSLTKKCKSKQSLDCNMGVAQDIIQSLTYRNSCQNLEMIVSVIKYFQKLNVLSIYFFNVL